MLHLLLFLGLPPGPDLCHLLGACPTAAAPSGGSNLLYLASALVLAGVVVHRTAPPKR